MPLPSLHTARLFALPLLWLIIALTVVRAPAQPGTGDAEERPIPETNARRIDPPNLLEWTCDDPDAWAYKVGKNWVSLPNPPPHGGPGEMNATLNSLSVQIGLGPARNSIHDVGRLLIEREVPAVGLASPAAIDTFGINKDQVQILRVSGVLRQLRTPQYLVDVVVLNPSSYEIRFYPVAAAGAKSEGIYLLAAGAIPSYVNRITSSDNRAHFLMERFEGPSSNNTPIQRHEFKYDEESQSWHLNRDGEFESVIKEEIYADGSTSGTSDPYLKSAFPAVPLSTDSLPRSVAGHIHGIYHPTQHTLSIGTPYGDYLLNLPELPDSGAGTNANFVVAAHLGPAGQPVFARKEVKYYGGVTNAAKVELTLYDVTNFLKAKKPLVHIVDPGGLKHVTFCSYIRDPKNRNLHGRLKFQVNPDRTWEWHTYDALGRRTALMTGGLDTHDVLTRGEPDPAVVDTTTYDYSPVSPLEATSIRTHRPRTTSRILDGVLASRVWNANYKDADGAEVVITEISAQPAAVFGDPANARAITTTHLGGLLNGLPKSEVDADGSVTTHTYRTGTFTPGPDNNTLGSWTFGPGPHLRQATVTVTAALPGGPPIKYFRTVTIYDDFRKVLERRTQLESDQNFD